MSLLSMAGAQNLVWTLAESVAQADRDMLVDVNAEMVNGALARFGVTAASDGDNVRKALHRAEERQSQHSAQVQWFLVRYPHILAHAASDKLELSLFHVVCAEGLRYLVSLLENQVKNELGMTDAGITPLHLAAFHGHAVVIDILCWHWHGCQILGELVNAQDCWGFTALHYASLKGHLSATQVLLHSTAGIDPNVKIKAEKETWKRLRDHGAVAVSALIQPYPDGVLHADRLVCWSELNVQVIFARGGATPLHLAALHGCESVVQLLLAHADTKVNAVDFYGMTSLHYAVARGHLDVVRSLVHHRKVDVNAATNCEGRYWGETPLHLAARVHMEGEEELTSRAEIARQLCSLASFQANCKNWQGKTALQIAWERQVKGMRLLLLQQVEIRRYLEALNVERQEQQQAMSALLVGGALIAGLTFPASPVLTGAGEGEPNLELLGFAIIDSQVAFFLACFSVVTAIAALLPVSYDDRQDEVFVGQVVRRLRRGIAASSCLITVALYLVLLAFLENFQVTTISTIDAQQGFAFIQSITDVGYASLDLVFCVFWLPLFAVPLAFLLSTAISEDCLSFAANLGLSPVPVFRATKLLSSLLRHAGWLSMLVFYLMGPRTYYKNTLFYVWKNIMSPLASNKSELWWNTSIFVISFLVALSYSQILDLKHITQILLVAGFLCTVLLPTWAQVGSKISWVALVPCCIFLLKKIFDWRSIFGFPPVTGKQYIIY